MSGRWCLCVAMWAVPAPAAEPTPQILVRGDAQLHVRPDEDADTLDLNLRANDIDPMLDAVAFAYVDVDETEGWIHVRSIAQPAAPTCPAPQSVRRRIGAGLAPTFALDLYVRADQKLSTAQVASAVPVCAPMPAGTDHASEPAQGESISLVGGAVLYGAQLGDSTPLTWLDGTPAGRTVGIISLSPPKAPRPDGRVCFSTASTGPYEATRWPALTVCAPASALILKW